MNIAVGKGKISDEVRAAIELASGSIEPTKQEDIVLVVLPEGEITSSSGNHVYSGSRKD
jgi:hypothetical protein